MKFIFRNFKRMLSCKSKNYKLSNNFPNIENKECFMIKNEWNDNCGNNYKILDNFLIIKVRNLFSNYEIYILNNINIIPDDFDIILDICFDKKNIDELSKLCVFLSSKKINKNIIVNVSKFDFSEKKFLDVERLSSNIKISSLMDDDYQESFFNFNESFESRMLNISDDKYKKILNNLTQVTLKRIKKLREISKYFYKSTPFEIKFSNYEKKSLYAYHWCLKNIKYDKTAVLSYGILKANRKDVLDPIITFENKKGVCEGRARLLKILLNNYYMKVPCFLVKGISNNHPHIWNEIYIDENVTLDLDISKLDNRIPFNHNELDSYIEKKEKSKIKRLK